MALSEGQRKILDIIAGLTGRTLSTSTMDAVVVDKSGLPAEEVRNYLSQLDVLGYITIGIKVSGADYRMINMTKEGLQVTSDNQRLRKYTITYNFLFSFKRRIKASSSNAVALIFFSRASKQVKGYC